MKDSFENIPLILKISLNLVETERGKEFLNKVFPDFFKKTITKKSINTSIRADFAERFNRTIKDLLTRSVLLKGDANWIYVLPTKTKQHFIRIHSSTKLTPKQASLKNNEGYVFGNLLDIQKKIK